MLIIEKAELSDIEAVCQKVDPFGVIEYRYNDDVMRDQAFVALRDGERVGVMFFLRHFSWNGADEPYHLLLPFIYASDSDAKLALIARATEWLKGDCAHFAGKRPALARFVDADDMAEISTYMEAGFAAYNVMPRLRYDLNMLREYPMPEGAEIVPLANTEDAVREYIDASAAANDGTPDSANDIRFIFNEPSFRCFTARVDGKFAAAVSIWRIEDGVSAVENIFCVPEFRRRGLMKWLITYAMAQARAAGYDYCELGMFGRNLRAQHLYSGMGFKLHKLQIELLYPVDIPKTLYLP